jgi:cytochrome c553
MCMKQSASRILILVVATLGAVGLSARAGELPDGEAAGAQASTQSSALELVTQVCETCHGENGNSTDPSVPSLAGQGSAYLANQLAGFQAQRRVGVMSGIAMNLTSADIRNTANYFSQQILKAGTARAPDSSALRRGQAIYDEGIAATNVPSCASCHALDGAGLPSAFPRLAGQHSRYIAAQLRAFRSDSRLSTNTMMQNVAAKLSNDEITAVANYIAGLQTNNMLGRAGVMPE